VTSTARFSSRALARAVVAVAVTAAVALTVAGCTAPADDGGSGSSATPTPTATSGIKPSVEVFPGGPFLDPRSEAMVAEEQLREAGKTEEARKIAQISQQPTAIWLGEWLTAEKMPEVLGEYIREAEDAGTTLVFVPYAIPNRDCGGLSAGGLEYDEYGPWAQALAKQLEGTGAVMIVEPDSLAMLFSEKCAGEEARRLPLIKGAVDAFGAAGLTSYLDAGNNNWIPERRMAEMLVSAGVENARGFFTNVSNFYRVDEEREYGEALSALLGGKRFVVDVSRNGNGWKGDWCNPTGAALGQSPVVTTSETTSLDALLWIKHPGISDGACNGGPKAGVWWEEQALDLVDNRPAKN
jgi:endoglucanase